MTDELSSLLSLLPVEASLVGGGLQKDCPRGNLCIYVWNSCKMKLDPHFMPPTTPISSHSPPPCLLGLLSLSESYSLLLSVTGCAHTSYSARVSSFIFIYERLSKIFLPNGVLDRTAGMFFYNTTESFLQMVVVLWIFLSPKSLDSFTNTQILLISGYVYVVQLFHPTWKVSSPREE